MRMNGYRCDICQRESIDGEVWHFIESRTIGETIVSTEPSRRLADTNSQLCSAACLLKYAENFAGVRA